MKIVLSLPASFAKASGGEVGRSRSFFICWIVSHIARSMLSALAVCGRIAREFANVALQTDVRELAFKLLENGKDLAGRGVDAFFGVLLFLMASSISWVYSSIPCAITEPCMVKSRQTLSDDGGFLIHWLFPATAS